MTIAPNTTITQAGYHYILDTVKTILSTASTGYGVLPASDYIGTGTLIRPVAWSTLYEDLNKVHHHQNGTATNVVNTATFPIATGAIIKRDFVNSLTNAVDTLSANIYTVHPSQIVSASTSSVSGTSTFTSILTSTVVYEWPNEHSIDWYFNLGGSLVTDLTAHQATPIDQHQQVIDLVNNFRTTIKDPFDRDLWLSTKTAPGRTYTVSASTSTSTGIFTDVFTVSNTYQIIDSPYANTSTIKVITEIKPTTVPALIPLFALTATVTVTNYSSTGTIQAIEPEKTYTRKFTNVEATTATRQTVRLTVSPDRLAYVLTGGGSSVAQNITVTNQHVDATSVPAVISNITIGSDVVTPIISHGSLPITIATGSSTTINLNWTKPTVTAKELGEHYNPLIIKSNNINGDIVIPTRTTVLEPPGTWAFSPTFATQSATTFKKFTQNVTIVPSYATIRNIVSYTLTQNGNNFSLEKIPSALDPVAVIGYTPNDPNTGAFVATLTITVEIIDISGDQISTTQSFTYTVNQILTDQNLGSWVSPYGPINSVIGASYDIIGGQRYLTLGVGMGADGSPTIDEGGGGYVNVNFLGVNASSLVASKYPFTSLTLAEQLSNFSSLLKNYGIRSTQNYITFTDPECTFDIDIQSTGNYDIRYSVYETGYIELDGNRIINLSAYNVNNFESESSATVYLSAGSHSLRFVGNLKMALTIRNASTGALVWSTLDAANRGGHYRYWYEVYRFPIYMNNQSVTYKSRDFRVKDTAGARTTAEKKYYPYGDFFGRTKEDRTSIFEVMTNGRGEISIIIVPPQQIGNSADTLTISSLFLAFYYFQTSIPRYTHKTGGQYDGNSTYTDYFLGFDKFGAVRTARTVIPRSTEYGYRNSVVDQVITFFLSSLIQDIIVIELGLFKSQVIVYTLEGPLVLYEQAISFGAWVAEKLGVNLGGNTTIGGYIVEQFSSFFTQTLPEVSQQVLANFLPSVEAAGTAIGGFASELAGVTATDLGFTAADLGIEIAAVTDELYIGESLAQVYASGFGTSLAETVALEAVAAGAPVWLVSAGGVALTAVGIAAIVKGLEEGKPGYVVAGATAAWFGWELLVVAAGSSCFTPDSKIEMADGTVKAIKDIKVGDKVVDSLGEKVNTVVYIEKQSLENFTELYSPSAKFKPFATLNHPLFIDGQLKAPSYDHYRWLDVKPLQIFILGMNKDEVYNLWVTGDHTYRVNGYGTVSIVDDGGAMLQALKHGYITDRHVNNIFADMLEDNLPANTHGTYMINKFLGRFDSRIIAKSLGYFMVADKSSRRRSMFWYVAGILGKAAELLKRSKNAKDNV